MVATLAASGQQRLGNGSATSSIWGNVLAMSRATRSARRSRRAADGKSQAALAATISGTTSRRLWHHVAPRRSSRKKRCGLARTFRADGWELLPRAAFQRHVETSSLAHRAALAGARLSLR
jgi:hypothetical protein